MAVDIAELERRARRVLTPEVYDYYAGGSGSERTLRASVRRVAAALADAPGTARRVRGRHQRAPARPAGDRRRTPVAVAPTGFQGLAHPEGELATARGAAAAGALTLLSSRCSRRIEDIGGPPRTAGAPGGSRSTCCATGTSPPDWSAARSPRARGHWYSPRTPRWSAGSGATGARAWSARPSSLSTSGRWTDQARADQAADLTFGDIGWLARLGGVPVLVKGVLRADDARACVTAGAAGVIVSNHGGRQLDRAVPTALALPAVAAEVGGSAAVFVDGGLRTGEDVLAALGLGARAVFLGRPVLWALACGGADGVRDLLAAMTADLAHLMALAGAPDLAGLAGVTRAPGSA